VPQPASERGLAETITVNRLGLTPSLLRTFKSTNPIESMISVGQWVTGNRQRWRDGQVVLLWTAADMLEAERQFRRINCYRDLHILERALQAHHEVVASTMTDRSVILTLTGSPDITWDLGIPPAVKRPFYHRCENHHSSLFLPVHRDVLHERTESQNS
jgi:hypothetical protein